MSNKIQPLKIYKKNNKLYVLSDMTTDDWSEEEIIHFAQQLEKYGIDYNISCDSSRPSYKKHVRINDYGDSNISIRESCGFQGDNFEMDLRLTEPNGDCWSLYISFIKPITPDKVRLVQKNCTLTTEERKWTLEYIMQELGLPTDKASVDNEIKNCVGLYEFIEI